MVDRFTLFIVGMFILVVIVVGNSQFQQFKLAQTAVDQNNIIVSQVNATIRDLNAAEKKIIEDNRLVVGQVSSQHNYILSFISNNTEKRSSENSDIKNLLGNNTLLVKQNSAGLAANLSAQHDVINEHLRAIHEILANHTTTTTPTTITSVPRNP